jgi:AraC-like DNA-binding protein
MTRHPLVREAQAYIGAHRHERVTVSAVTRTLGTKRVTLGKHFRRELDATLFEYVRWRRLTYAIECLRKGGSTVDQVASDCGFSSTSYFSRILKPVTGFGPGALRGLHGTQNVP